MKPLLIAHRGDTINQPENTLAAFGSAFERGADGVELDLQYFKDQLIVVHDYLFDQSKQYCRLEEAMDAYAQSGRLEIEIKCLDLDFVKPFQDLLARYEQLDIEITTSVWPLMNHLRKAFKKYQLGVIFPDYHFETWMTSEFLTTKIIKSMELLQGNVAHVPLKVVSQSLTDACHERGFKIHTHIPMQPLEQELKIYENIKKLGIDQCTIDDINLPKHVKRAGLQPF